MHINVSNLRNNKMLHYLCVHVLFQNTLHKEYTKLGLYAKKVDLNILNLKKGIKTIE